MISFFLFSSLYFFLFYPTFSLFFQYSFGFLHPPLIHISLVLYQTFLCFLPFVLSFCPVFFLILFYFFFSSTSVLSGISILFAAELSGVCLKGDCAKAQMISVMTSISRYLNDSHKSITWSRLRINIISSFYLFFRYASLSPTFSLIPDFGQFIHQYIYLFMFVFEMARAKAKALSREVLNSRRLSDFIS